MSSFQRVISGTILTGASIYWLYKTAWLPRSPVTAPSASLNLSLPARSRYYLRHARSRQWFAGFVGVFACRQTHLYLIHGERSLSCQSITDYVLLLGTAWAMAGVCTAAESDHPEMPRARNPFYDSD